jgi:CRP/FNR family transcriptional regulator, anaerobic regulatory protein
MANDNIFKPFQIFTKLPPKDVEQLLEAGTHQTLPSNTFIAKEKQYVNDFYFFKTGIVRHFVTRENGVEFTKNFIMAPDFVSPSLSDFFLRTPSITNCETLAESEVIRWDYDTWFAFAEKHPKVFQFLIMGLARAFRKKEVKEIQLNQLSATERYNVFLTTYPNLITQVPLQYIASYLNIRPETLSRIRAQRIS